MGDELAWRYCIMAVTESYYWLRCCANLNSDEFEIELIRCSVVSHVWQEYSHQKDIKNQQKEKCTQAYIRAKIKYSLFANINDHVHFFV